MDESKFQHDKSNVRGSATLAASRFQSSRTGSSPPHLMSAGGFARSSIQSIINGWRWRAEHRKLAVRRDELVTKYLGSNEVTKLNLGAGSYALDSWLNTDIFPTSSQIAYLDAREPFPVPGDRFDYVFSEHMIEHLTFVQGAHMIRECFRVLRKGGILRIATSDLLGILAVLTTPNTAEATEYAQWAVKFNKLPADENPGCHVGNKMFYGFGHQFLYDRATLSSLLSQTGFVDVRECAVGVSTHISLQGVESHFRSIGEPSNRFETMIFESRKA
jgi:SAM-dependent methyltransferase